MPVYTKTGDTGKTSLLGGKRVKKDHPRIAAYGTVDELIAYLGLIRTFDIPEVHRKSLLEIQDRLMTAAALLAKDRESCDIALPQLYEKDVAFLEKEMDRMDQSNPPLKNFILPGGSPVVAFCHVARSVCRRAERLSVRLFGKHEMNLLVVKYLNRLSDYLFVLARNIGHELNVEETIWEPRL